MQTKCYTVVKLYLIVVCLFDADVIFFLHDSSCIRRMARCCAFLVFIWAAGLHLTSSNTTKFVTVKKECDEEATRKIGHLLKDREEKDKTIPRNKYQILQRGEGSFASSKEWLLAIKSEICTGCLVKKMCSHPQRVLYT